MAAPVGALRVTLGANTAQFEQGMRRAQNQARATGQSITGSMDRMRVRTVQAFGAIRVAAAGLGLGLGAGLFVDQARKALEFASSLGEVAQSIGLTVEQVQILNRAALDTGGSIEGAQRSMAILNRTLGQARAGVPAAAQAFRSLRIDPEQFRSAGEVLPVVMDRIRNLRTVSEQAAAAQGLMGRGAAETLPLLVQGSEGWDRYARAARAAGLVTTEQARRADEAMDKLSALGTTIRTNLAIAIANAIPDIENLAGSLMRVASAANTALRALSGFSGINLGNIGGLMTLPFTLPHRIAGEIGRRTGLIREQHAPVGMGAIFQASRAVLQAGQNAPTITGDMDLDLSPTGGGGRHGGGNARAEREKALRDEHEFQTQMRRFREDTLRAQQDQIVDAVARNQLEDQLLVIEREQFDADQALEVQLGNLTQARADQAAAARTALDAEKQGALELERRRMVEEETRELADARHEIAASALRQEADLAETAAERRDAELRLLDLTYRHERAKLKELAAAERLAPLEQQRAQAALDDLDRRHAADQRGVMAGTRGPMEDFLSRLPQTAAQANEALEAVAANGLQSITDGLADAIMMTRSWGDVFKNIAKQIIGDLMRIGLQRTLAGLLGGQGVPGFLGGIFGPGSSGTLGSASSSAGAGAIAFGGFGGVRAKGGPVIPGRTYVVGENGPELLSMGSSRGFVAPNGAAGGARVQIVPSPYFDVVVDGRVVSTGGPMMAVAANTARVGAQVDISRRNRQRIP